MLRKNIVSESLAGEHLLYTFDTRGLLAIVHPFRKGQASWSLQDSIKKNAEGLFWQLVS